MKFLNILKDWKRIVVIIIDLIIITLTFYLAFWIRSLDEKFLLHEYFVIFKQTLSLVTIVYLFSFIFFGLYKGLWQYASVKELLRIFKAVAIGSFLTVGGMVFVLNLRGFPRSVYIIHPLLLFLFVGASRFGGRIFKHILPSSFLNISDLKQVILVGAGDAGEMIVRESLRHPENGYRVVGFVDDDAEKVNKDIHGIKILGLIETLPEIVKRKSVDEIVITIPSASREQIRRIIDVCNETKVPFKITPSLSDVIGGKVAFDQVRKVEVKDILSREAVKLDSEGISHYISGKKILITGAGGSIGSELCRQLTRFNPELLILFGRGEFSLYNTERELRERYPSLAVTPVIANIRDESRTRAVLNCYKPDVIFHVAAHKHVPLMEANPCEAIKNNVVGSKILMEAAEDYDVKRFVLISTDKAVNSVNFMGVSKRIAELLLQSMAKRNRCKFSAVRFGNVLESRGSVVPLFKQQITKGGPITITHPEVTRYFMTVSEAAQLVIQAGAMGEGGEIFVLNMGDPVKIIDLARDLIRLSGFEPEIDIKIKVSGLRPGERMHEKLVAEGEKVQATQHEKILIIKPNEVEAKRLSEAVKELEKLAVEEDIQGLVKKIREIVPEFSHQTRIKKLKRIGR